MFSGFLISCLEAGFARRHVDYYHGWMRMQWHFFPDLVYQFQHAYPVILQYYLALLRVYLGEVLGKQSRHGHESDWENANFEQAFLFHGEPPCYLEPAGTSIFFVRALLSVA